MTIEEMQSFSIKEIESFSINELGKTPSELVKLVTNDGADISYNAYTKLCQLCDSVNAHDSIDPKHKLSKPQMSVKDFVDAIYKLSWIAIHVAELKELIIHGLESLLP